jgi:hypothetical protein
LRSAISIDVEIVPSGLLVAPYASFALHLPTLKLSLIHLLPERIFTLTLVEFCTLDV